MGRKVGIVIQTRPAEAPAVPAKTTRDVLLHAALLIEERGWSNDAPLCEDGSRCAGGAISFVGLGETWVSRNPLVDAAARQLMEHVGHRHRYIPMGAVADWNDSPGRTAFEVIAALRAAAGPTLTYTDPAGGPDWEPRRDEA